MNTKDDSFDIIAAAKNLKARHEAKKAKKHRLFIQAFKEAQSIIAMIASKYAPERIYQWGSLLDENHFNENSDIDIAVQGLTSPQQYFALLGDAMNLSTFPLDIIELERIDPVHKESILLKGKMIYERQQ